MVGGALEDIGLAADLGAQRGVFFGVYRLQAAELGGMCRGEALLLLLVRGLQADQLFTVPLPLLLLLAHDFAQLGL